MLSPIDHQDMKQSNQVVTPTMTNKSSPSDGTETFGPEPRTSVRKSEDDASQERDRQVLQAPSMQNQNMKHPPPLSEVPMRPHFMPRPRTNDGGRDATIFNPFVETPFVDESATKTLANERRSFQSTMDAYIYAYGSIETIKKKRKREEDDMMEESSSSEGSFTPILDTSFDDVTMLFSPPRRPLTLRSMGGNRVEQDEEWILLPPGQLRGQPHVFVVEQDEDIDDMDIRVVSPDGSSPGGSSSSLKTPK